MGCCGQKREVFKNNPLPATPLQGTEQASRQEIFNGQYREAGRQTQSVVSIRYLDSSTITLEGPATGRWYEFSSAHPVQPVDSRDAGALLRMSFFRPA